MGWTLQSIAQTCKNNNKYRFIVQRVCLQHSIYTEVHIWQKPAWPHPFWWPVKCWKLPEWLGKQHWWTSVRPWSSVQLCSINYNTLHVSHHFVNLSSLCFKHVLPFGVTWLDVVHEGEPRVFRPRGEDRRQTVQERTRSVELGRSEKGGWQKSGPNPYSLP